MRGDARQPRADPDTPRFAERAIETDRVYFEMGANIEPLPGAVLAWMPALTACPAGAVIHRVDLAVVAALGGGWVAETERALAQVGAGLARIYMDARDPVTDSLLRAAGFADREELVFGHSLPDPPPGMRLHSVRSDEDWARKLRFHEAAEATPDGHSSRASDWAALERRKCEHGMDAYWAEIGEEIVGMIGIIQGDGLLRLKNLVIHPAYRRRAVATALLSHAAVVGRQIGLSYQCVLAVSGEAGELLYRAAGMQVIGSQIEWSKRLAAA